MDLARFEVDSSFTIPLSIGTVHVKCIDGNDLTALEVFAADTVNEDTALIRQVLSIAGRTTLPEEASGEDPADEGPAIAAAVSSADIEAVAQRLAEKHDWIVRSVSKSAKDFARQEGESATSFFRRVLARHHASTLQRHRDMFSPRIDRSSIDLGARIASQQQTNLRTVLDAAESLPEHFESIRGAIEHLREEVAAVRDEVRGLRDDLKEQKGQPKG